MQKKMLILSVLICSQVFSQTPQMYALFTSTARQLGVNRPETPRPQRCQAPRDYGWWQAFYYGEVYYTPNLGASIVQEPILSIWAGTGKTKGRLGFPLATWRRDRTGYSETMDIQDFEGGTIYYNYVTRQNRISYNEKMLGPGNYRLILCGFKVEQETTDNLLETDGKGDEIYIRTDAFITDKQGKTTVAPSYQTKVIGDVNGQENRIMAGSRSDRGGLKTGDMYPSNTPWAVSTLPPSIAGGGNQLPMKIWEGEINDANSLFIIPSVWEWDEHRPSELENNWSRMVNEVLNFPPYQYSRFNLKNGQATSIVGIPGNLPFGSHLGVYTPTANYVYVNSPIIMANNQGFYFGFMYENARPANDNTHSPDIFEAVFRNGVAPFGKYRLYLKWEKLSVITNPTKYSGLIK